jgi:hypothetical protein
LSMTFRATVRIGFVDGAETDVRFTIEAGDEDDVKRQVTREYIMAMSNDWGRPIVNVTLIQAEAFGRGSPSQCS